MIRLMGLVNMKPIGSPVGARIEEAELTDKQKKLDVDKDGEIEGSDLAKLRAKNETHGGDHEVSMANNSLDTIIKMATELKAKMGSGQEKDIPAWIQDHITQAQNFISQAASNYHEYDTPTTTPMEGMCEGEECEDTPPLQEKEGPCWKGYQQIGMKMKDGKEVPNCVPIKEAAPEGWEGTVKAMKKHKEIDNPWALAHYMKNKGYKSHKGE